MLCVLSQDFLVMLWFLVITFENEYIYEYFYIFDPNWAEKYSIIPKSYGNNRLIDQYSSK